jgi:uncharacterized protein involved in type VI secretion and phage assembly
VIDVETLDPGRVLLARWFGVYPALVSDVKDPDGQGRVKVTLPWAPDGDGGSYETWARLATLLAGSNKGTWFIPSVHDEVLVCFEAGDPRRPYVIGSLWNGSDAPPASMDGNGSNYLEVIRSKNGVKVTLDDHDGQEKLILETPGGQKVTLQDGPGSILIEDANGNSAKLEAGGITLTTSAKLSVSASSVSISAATVSVDSGAATFSGMVKCDTLIANSVVGTSYTPGAGNMW